MSAWRDFVLTKEELTRIKREAVQRYIDTSWQIHRQNSQKKNIGIKSVNEFKNHISKGTDSEQSDNKNNYSSSPENDILAQIDNETIETTYEPMKNQSQIQMMLTSAIPNHDEDLGEVSTRQPRATFGAIRGGLSGGASMDLTYVSERIIAMWFSSSTNSHTYRQGQRQAAHMLRNKYGDNYMVFNLSESKTALRNEHKHVLEVGWPQILAPPLEKLCSTCKQIESWLSEDDHRIAVLHARGNNRDKLGVIVTAYMNYSEICGRAEQALDRFSMRRFLEDTVGPLVLPSNKRYVEYFSGLLSHNIKINASPLYLTHVTVLGGPKFCEEGCRAILKLYEGQIPVYTSGVYDVRRGLSEFTVDLSGDRGRGLELRGDILVKCYHYNNNSGGNSHDLSGRETVFSCQFHTCAVADYTLVFTRQELDVACDDPRFSADGAVKFHFSSSASEGRPHHQVPDARIPAVSFINADDSINGRVDSPFFAADDEHDGADPESDEIHRTFGRLDNSIYATVSKKPELSPGFVSSPLTVSMDSGISSAGHHQNNITHAAAFSTSSPPPTAEPSPLTPEDQHRELDELLSDMMLTVQSIPDLKTKTRSGGTVSSIEDGVRLRYIDDEDDDEPEAEGSSHSRGGLIPYHAREDSRPFTYGPMVADAKTGLSSPSLVRKASVNRSHGDSLNKVQIQVYPQDFSRVPDFTTSPTPRRREPFISNGNFSAANSRSTPAQKQYVRDPIDDIFTQSALEARNAADSRPIRRDFREEFHKDEVRRYDPLMKRSYTDSSIKRRIPTSTSSAYSDSESLSPPYGLRDEAPDFNDSYAAINANNTRNLTWLQKQQLKLKERRDTQLRDERHPQETRLLTELRQIHQSRHTRPTASHRLDGYTSDTTAFADDDDDFAIPLHINITQQQQQQKNESTTATSPVAVSNALNSQSTKYTAVKNERPFMQVKRAHEKFAQNPEMTPASILMANPLGQVMRSPPGTQNKSTTGLLTMVEQRQNYNLENNSKTTTDPNFNIISNNKPGSYREENYQFWSEVDSASPVNLSSSRPQTPAFPVAQARTPYANATTPTLGGQFQLTSERLPPKSPTTQRKEFSNEYSHTITQRSAPFYTPDSNQNSPKITNGSPSPTAYFSDPSRRNSVHSSNSEPQEVSPANVKFVRDTSKYWYRPTITRESAISALRDQPPGTFVVRDSNSFPGAFGMAVRVASAPVSTNQKGGGGDELIRHFLIEPTSKGVRLKGCPSEPVFSSLSALIYQHSVIPLALPCRLLLPEGDLLRGYRGEQVNPVQQLLTQGAACNVLFLGTLDMESLTGPEAVKKAVVCWLNRQVKPESVIVHFKVNGLGVTLTDNKRKLFFRRHYPIGAMSHCGLDPDDHRWGAGSDLENGGGTPRINTASRIFGLIARKPNTNKPENQCHLFVELEPEQPATAIVNFVNKVLALSSSTKPNMV